MQPVNLVASLLGVSQSNTAGSLANATTCVETKNKPATASCSGWSRPDPAVRLRLTDDNTARIFGFPPDGLPTGVPRTLPHFGNSGPPLLYLRGDVQPYLEYVIGSDWREKPLDDHKTNDQHTYHDGKVILRPGASTNKGTVEAEATEDERAHCVRMLRCGARGIRSEVDANSLDTIGWETPPKQIFGWPSSGGVWILRYPPFDKRTFMLDAVRVNPETIGEYTRQEHQYLQLEDSLSQYSDMDELCRALEGAGGEYYAAIEDCPEVVELELITV